MLCFRDFLKCLAGFPKPLIAGVHGPTVGLGVTMLPLFDMVFASDKATFHTPYARLGQVPEGAATLTLPYMLGYTLVSLDPEAAPESALVQPTHHLNATSFL